MVRFPEAEAYNHMVNTLNALEKAIVDICDIDTVHAIQAQKKVMLKR